MPLRVLYEDKIVWVADITTTHYICYDCKGNHMWIPKEDCEVI